MVGRTTIYRAAALADARGAAARDAALAVRDGRIVAWGDRASVRATVGLGDHEVSLPDRLLLPGLVNAHAHLDLSSLGPVPPQPSFIDWISLVIQHRPRGPAAVAESVRQGLRLSRGAGTFWIGDIARLDALDAHAQADPEERLGGVAYLESLGRGGEALERARSDLAAALERLPVGAFRWLVGGTQPHAPYSTDPGLYDLAADQPMDLPRSTHLAETLEEDRFVRDAAGPFAELLRRLGRWDDGIRPRRVSPVQHLNEALARGRWLLAHCNYLSDDDIAMLAQTKASVAYCPIASEYFGHVGHRYRDLLAAGVNVCLGTDSILCQPPNAVQPLGMLAPMRRLHRRDGVAPTTLLAMATWRGLVALRGPEAVNWASFQVGAPAAVVAVRIDPDDALDPLTQALRNDYPVETIHVPDWSGQPNFSRPA